MLGVKRTGRPAATPTVGAVRSMLMFCTVAEALFPTWSEHEPGTDWFAPSDDNVVGGGGLPAARPESASEHWNETTTGVLFHPFGFAAGSRDPVIVGAERSITHVKNAGVGSGRAAISTARTENV